MPSQAPADHGRGAAPLDANAVLSRVTLWAIKCLYADEALPRGPLVQWLLQLMVGQKVSPRELRNLIEGTPGVSMEPANSKRLNFRAVLDVPPPGFKGFASEENLAGGSFDEGTWQEAARWIALGGWPKAEEHSHKYYVVASWLQDSSERMRELSFGQVLGIVRCAAQTGGGLLGHRGGLLVPYAESEECERKVNACTGLPTHVAPDERFVQSWEELKRCLTYLLKMQGEEALEVSKVKSQCLALLQVELSETVFGYQCLSKLLGDPQLQDEFLLEAVQGNRYTLRLKGAPEPTPRKERVCLSLADAVEASPEPAILPEYGTA